MWREPVIKWKKDWSKQSEHTVLDHFWKCQEHFDPRNVQEREKLHVVYPMLPFSNLIQCHVHSWVTFILRLYFCQLFLRIIGDFLLNNGIDLDIQE